MPNLTGGCLCGHIRFETQGEPGFPHTCSCRMCQRHTGSLTATWVELPSDPVTWTGPGGRPTIWRSSYRSSRSFCPECGSSERWRTRPWWHCWPGRSTHRTWWH